MISEGGATVNEEAKAPRAKRVGLGPNEVDRVFEVIGVQSQVVRVLTAGALPRGGQESFFATLELDSKE